MVTLSPERISLQNVQSCIQMFFAGKYVTRWDKQRTQYRGRDILGTSNY